MPEHTSLWQDMRRCSELSTEVKVGWFSAGEYTSSSFCPLPLGHRSAIGMCSSNAVYFLFHAAWGNLVVNRFTVNEYHWLDKVMRPWSHTGQIALGNCCLEQIKRIFSQCVVNESVNIFCNRYQFCVECHLGQVCETRNLKQYHSDSSTDLTLSGFGIMTQQNKMWQTVNQSLSWLTQL